MSVTDSVVGDGDVSVDRVEGPGRANCHGAGVSSRRPRRPASKSTVHATFADGATATGNIASGVFVIQRDNGPAHRGRHTVALACPPKCRTWPLATKHFDRYPVDYAVWGSCIMYHCYRTSTSFSSRWTTARYLPYMRLGWLVGWLVGWEINVPFQHINMLWNVVGINSWKDDASERRAENWDWRWSSCVAQWWAIWWVWRLRQNMSRLPYTRKARFLHVAAYES